MSVLVGLDYHQASPQLRVLNPQGKQLINRDCPNDWQAIARMAG